MSYTNLADFYRNTFTMTRHHGFSIEDIMRLYPFERDIYIDMISEYLEKIAKGAEG